MRAGKGYWRADDGSFGQMSSFIDDFVVDRELKSWTGMLDTACLIKNQSPYELEVRRILACLGYLERVGRGWKRVLN